MSRRVADLTADEIARAAWDRRSWTGVAQALGFSCVTANAVRLRAHVLGIHEDCEALQGWGRPGRKVGAAANEPAPPLVPAEADEVPVDDENWMIHGACRGVNPDLFFPERGEDTKAAKAVCAVCPVRERCLDHAIVNMEKFGIWGGKSERERRKLRAQRYRQAMKVSAS